VAEAARFAEDALGHPDLSAFVRRAAALFLALVPVTALAGVELLAWQRDPIIWRSLRMRLDWFRRLCPPMLTAGLLLVAGCTVIAPEATPPNPIPPIPQEAIPKPPVSEEPMIWQPGYWNWTGDGYLWQEGGWEPRAGHGTMWQDGYWSREGMGWRWVPAHWL